MHRWQQTGSSSYYALGPQHTTVLFFFFSFFPPSYFFPFKHNTCSIRNTTAIIFEVFPLSNTSVESKRKAKKRRQFGFSEPFLQDFIFEWVEASSNPQNVRLTSQVTALKVMVLRAPQHNSRLQDLQETSLHSSEYQQQNIIPFPNRDIELSKHILERSEHLNCIYLVWDEKTAVVFQLWHFSLPTRITLLPLQVFKPKNILLLQCWRAMKVKCWYLFPH